MCMTKEFLTLFHKMKERCVIIGDEKIGRNIPLNDEDELFFFKLYEIFQNDDYFERWMNPDGFEPTTEEQLLFSTDG